MKIGADNSELSKNQSPAGPVLRCSRRRMDESSPVQPVLERSEGSRQRVRDLAHTLSRKCWVRKNRPFSLRRRLARNEVERILRNDFRQSVAKGQCGVNQLQPLSRQKATVLPWQSCHSQMISVVAFGDLEMCLPFPALTCGPILYCAFGTGLSESQEAKVRFRACTGGKTLNARTCSQAVAP